MTSVINPKAMSQVQSIYGRTLWIAVNGETRCSRHGGFELLSSIFRSPEADQHLTHSNHWVRADKEFLGALSDAECEVCR